MDKTDVINVIQREINTLFSKPLTAQSVDLLFKLTTIQNNLKNVPVVANIPSENQHSNKKLDKDINGLFEKYVIARKGKNDCEITDSLMELLGEIADLVIEIYNNSTCQKERDLITESLKKMEMH